MAVPGFAFRPRRIRGVTDLPVRLPAACPFELLAVFSLEIDISSLLGRGPVDVPGICGG